MESKVATPTASPTSLAVAAPLSVSAPVLPVFTLGDQLPPAAQLIATRDGHVLGPNLILKVDAYQSKRAAFLDSGTPIRPSPTTAATASAATGAAAASAAAVAEANALKVLGVPFLQAARDRAVLACGQPGYSGIRTLLNILKSHSRHGNVRVIWINLREEPIIYINGRCFVLRDYSRPFRELVRLSFGHSHTAHAPLLCSLRSANPNCGVANGLLAVRAVLCCAVAAD
jgi:hypothetical protein